MSWDDGKHAKVKRVELTFDDVIRSIQVEYEGTTLQSQRRGTVGTKSDGFTLSTDEYITDVSGYYRTTFSGDIITALTFKTNKKTYGPYGNKTQHYFSASAPKDSQIAGFLGTSGNALSSIDVHFAPIPPPGSIRPTPIDPGTKPSDGPKPVQPGTKPSDGPKPVDPGTKPEDGPKPDSSGESNPKPDGSGKTGLTGGKGGKTFDDGVFDGVKKITVGADGYSVTYIKIEYVKDGKVETREHGTISGELKEYSVPNYPDDYITAVGGTYDLVFTYGTTLITSLYFTTSRGFTSPLFRKTDDDVLGEEFTLKGENGEKLVGFHGRGDTAIDAIGAYFGTGSKPVVPGKTGLKGGKGGNAFDDGVFDGVKKITVGADEFSVTYIKIEYVKDGKVETREHGESRGPLKEYSVPNYPDDYITAVGGTYDHVFTYDTTLITSLYFTTSRGFTSPLFRKTDEDVLGEKFNLKGENGGKLVGLHGLDGTAINAIGAYFDTGSQGGEGGNSGGGDSKPDGSETKPGKDGLKPDASGKTGLVGGESGNTFDDGVFDGVKKITVGANEDNVTYIKIEYVKDGKVETREHGENRGPLKEFSVDHPRQNITAVGGSYNHNFTYDTTLITSLYFETSNGTTSPLFGKTAGENFKLKGENGEKLVGLHGRDGTAINAIGAYFDTGSKPVVPGTKPGDDSSTQKLDAQGGKGGNEWDDGGDHDGVTKIHVTASGGNVSQIRFDYLKNGQPKEGPAHGVKGRRSYDETFEIIHPKDYLVSVKGWYDSSNIIQGLQFQSSTETFEYFPSPFSGQGTEFSLEVKDKKIVGFHGFADTHVNSLGAYFAPITSTPLKPSKKLKAVGGDEGAAWDDGAFDGVRKIQVGQNNDGVSFVTVEYNKGSQTVLGDGHGKKSPLGVETFKLEYPGEYITAVGVYYDKVQVEGRNVTLVTSLKFITNKQESPPFGLTGGEYSELKEEGHKIVGFHGKASDWVHQLGVHVAPITN